MKRIITLQQAKNQYVHRYTMEHVPNWSKEINTGLNKYYAPQYATDKEWYDNTRFPGEMAYDAKITGNYCVAINQTFPLGHWLEQPYQL